MPPVAAIASRAAARMPCSTCGEPSLTNARSDRARSGMMTLTEPAKDEPRFSRATVYDRDFYKWCLDEVEKLRERRLSELDASNLIEELESMGKEQRHALRSSYRLVILHLLKWQFQPERRTRSWRSTITRERVNIADREQDSKTLRDQAPALVREAYRGAVLRAASETDLPGKAFPELCPYPLEQ